MVATINPSKQNLNTYGSTPNLTGDSKGDNYRVKAIAWDIFSRILVFGAAAVIVAAIANPVTLPVFVVIATIAIGLPLLAQARSVHYSNLARHASV